MEMNIKGVEGMSGSEISRQVQQGGQFVMFQYCISVLFVTFKRASPIYFVQPGENVINKGLLFSLISFLLGWWGFPWGPVYTIQVIVANFQGGKDVTQQVVAAIKHPQLR